MFRCLKVKFLRKPFVMLLQARFKRKSYCKQILHLHIWMYIALNWKLYDFVVYRLKLCFTIYGTLGSPLFLLLFFEPLSIAFETMQVISFILFSHLMKHLSAYSLWSLLISSHMVITSTGLVGSWISDAWYLASSFSWE